jgi:hypothetical protein
LRHLPDRTIRGDFRELRDRRARTTTRGDFPVTKEPSSLVSTTTQVLIPPASRISAAASSLPLTQALLDTANPSDFQINYGDLTDVLQRNVAQRFQALSATIPAGYPQSQVPQLRGQANRMGEGFLQGWLHLNKVQ